MTTFKDPKRPILTKIPINDGYLKHKSCQKCRILRSENDIKCVKNMLKPIKPIITQIQKHIQMVRKDRRLLC